MTKVPGLIPFFGGSLISLVLVIISNRMFETLEKNNKKYIEEQEKK